MQNNLACCQSKGLAVLSMKPILKVGHICGVKLGYMNWPLLSALLGTTEPRLWLRQYFYSMNFVKSSKSSQTW